MTWTHDIEYTPHSQSLEVRKAKKERQKQKMKAILRLKKKLGCSRTEARRILDSQQEEV